MTAPLITRPAYTAANKKLIHLTQQRTAAILQAIGWGTDDDVHHGASMVADVIAAAQVLMGNWVNTHLGPMIGLPAYQLPAPSAPLLARDNVTPIDEYKRPFITGRAVGPDAAFQRMKNMTATDIQLAKVKQAHRVLQQGDIELYMRVTTSEDPCDLCLIASTQIYHTDDLMPIHAGTCMCDVEPIPAGWGQQQLDNQLPDDDDIAGQEGGDDEYLSGLLDKLDDATQPSKSERAEKLRNSVTVNDHSELGPVLGWKGQHFTDAAQANARTGDAA